jgi:hypothetical protein
MMGGLLIVVAAAIVISCLALLLITLYLAWTNPEKLDNFRRNVIFKLPGYDLFPRVTRSPLTTQRLWAIRIAGGLVLLFIIVWVILIINVSSQ